MRKWWIQYRGALKSCDYSCHYCPFPKGQDSRADLLEDARQLGEFVRWASAQCPRHLGVLFTPWGEAAIHRHYREAMVSLSRLSHIDRVAIQTNLSGSLDWLRDGNGQSIGVWATYHPGQVTRARFLRAVESVLAAGARLSVGVVGLREHLGEIQIMRRELPDHVYLWINACERASTRYTTGELSLLKSLDPLFGLSVSVHRTLGQGCWAGECAFAVNGQGTVRRCHFVPEPIGHLYRGNLADALHASPCPSSTCTCHIGYVHLKRLGLHELYGDGLLERIPDAWCAPPAAVKGVPQAAAESGGSRG